MNIFDRMSLMVTFDNNLKDLVDLVMVQLPKIAIEDQTEPHVHYHSFILVVSVLLIGLKIITNHNVPNARLSWLDRFNKHRGL